MRAFTAEETKVETSDSGRGIHVPEYPDFDRLPFRPPENAVYREDPNVPPRMRDNPLYLALPGPRNTREVKCLIERNNPVPEQLLTSLPAEARRERIDEVDSAVFALPRHILLEDMVASTIRNSFASRGWHFHYIEEATSQANHLGATPVIQEATRGGAVGAGSLFGDVGLGKTLSMVTIITACPQTIRHHTFRGQRLGILQVVWLYLSMPPKASASGLLAWIASTLDYILGTSYRSDVEISKNHTAQVRVVARALAVHAVGVIFCDEVQNICIGSSTERAVFENTLQELINYTHTRWCFIGTKSARDSIRSSALRRRLSGERGRIVWDPLQDGLEWHEFITRLWKWQATRVLTELTPNLSKVLLRLSGGIPDQAKRLFTTAQANIIGKTQHPTEELTENVFINTMRQSFPEEHRELERRFRIENPDAKELGSTR